MQIDNVHISMTKAAWKAQLAEALTALEAAEPGHFELTFYGMDENAAVQVGITFDDDDMVTGRDGRTDDECYIALMP